MVILKTEEVAEMLRVDPRTIQRQAKDARFPECVCTKVGNQYRFIKEELIKYLFKKEFPIGE